MRDARHREIGRRFRQVAAKINWENVRNSFLPLQEAYESLQRPAKLAGEEGVFSRAEKMDTIRAEGNSQGGKIVRALYDLVRHLSVDSERERFRAHLKTQSGPVKLSTDEIQQISNLEYLRLNLARGSFRRWTHLRGSFATR